ncbi:MAG: hypothetical protein K8R46_13160, partial [Pirellulales bacterium]|nr:hypothetical protein [Pirellulales bacterium]
NIYFYPGVKAFLTEQQKQEIEKHSLAVDQGFKDVKNGDFRLKRNSQAIKLGFVPFETNQDSFGITAGYPENLLNIAYNENDSSVSTLHK